MSLTPTVELIASPILNPHWLLSVVESETVLVTEVEVAAHHRWRSKRYYDKIYCEQTTDHLRVTVDSQVVCLLVKMETVEPGVPQGSVWENTATLPSLKLCPAT